jgi:hypothetical protein
MKQSKNEKIEEWRGLGLATDEQRYGWWQGRCGIAGVGRRSEGSGSGQSGRAQSGSVQSESANGNMLDSGMAQQQLQDLTQDLGHMESPREDGQFSMEGGWQPVGVEFSVPALVPGEDVIAAPLEIQGQWRKYF